MKFKFATAFIALCILMMGMISAQNNIVGTWKTIDDDGETVKSLLQITEGTDGKLYGTITKLFREPGEDPDPVCDKCSEKDSRYKKKVIGMTILRNLKKESDKKYSSGKILDPNNGKEYDCYVELVEPGKLKVRGYIGISAMGRTQYWFKQ
ncbi:MAG: DUF2147 domain-containing protein [Bacteroidia bacterium]|nr:DUF2147 domain-containing protein [Bacteroidia bacterium]